MSIIRIHFDTHGHINTFPKYPHSNIQAGRTLIKNLSGQDIHLGDLGFDYSPIKHLTKESFLFLPGNHDNYDNLPQSNIGDFGVYNFCGLDFFYVRGEFSIDKQYREWSGPNKSWWSQEQLSYSQMCECLELYQKLKPKTVLSHGAPFFLYQTGILKSNFRDIEPSDTAKLLNMMWNIHQPDYWFFAHWHQKICQTVMNTVFYCGEELQYVDLSVVNGNISVGEIT